MIAPFKGWPNHYKNRIRLRARSPFLSNRTAGICGPDAIPRAFAGVTLSALVALVLALWAWRMPCAADILRAGWADCHIAADCLVLFSFADHRSDP